MLALHTTTGEVLYNTYNDIRVVGSRRKDTQDNPTALKAISD